MLDFLGSKKLKEARQEIENMRAEVTDLKEKIKSRRLTESTYLFSGDLTPDAIGQSKEQRSDLNTADYWTLQKQCYDCFKLFPYAKRVIEMTTDYMLQKMDFGWLEREFFCLIGWYNKSINESKNIGSGDH